MYGRVTKVVARIIPGTAKITLIPNWFNKDPKKLLLPKRRTNTIPEITGEIVRGRSSNVKMKFLPWKSNLVIAQAADKPKTKLRSMEITVVKTVNLIAVIVSGSEIELKKLLIPFPNASLKITTNGITKKIVKNKIAVIINVKRIYPGSFNAEILYSETILIIIL